jgi:hypothetical protein
MTVTDPLCELNDCYPWTGRVSHPTDTGLASIYVCSLPSHRDDAARWVEELTGTRGEFFTFPNKRAAS